MKHFLYVLLSIGGLVLGGLMIAHAMVNDSRSLALEAATPYIEKGYSMRYEFWDGELKEKEAKLISHQLFKGNEYWFWCASDYDDAKLRIDAYDETGQLLENENWQRGNVAGTKIVPDQTGTYYIRIEILKAPKDVEKVVWALAYAYK